MMMMMMMMMMLVTAEGKKTANTTGKRKRFVSQDDTSKSGCATRKKRIQKDTGARCNTNTKVTTTRNKASKKMILP